MKIGLQSIPAGERGASRPISCAHTPDISGSSTEEAEERIHGQDASAPGGGEDANAPRAPRILIAGVGNISMGDDAFGCEVARRLSHKSWGGQVRVADFGIRSFDLAYAIADGYHAVVLIDAVSRGKPPGTVFLIEPPAKRKASVSASSAKGRSAGKASLSAPFDSHTLNLEGAMRMADSIGRQPENVFLVGCEPGVLDPGDGHMGLSTAVAEAVPRAMGMVETLVSKLLKQRIVNRGRAPV